MIFTGALGNVLDSAFYGVLFDRGMTYLPMFESWVPYGGVAEWGGGYAAPLMGNVVDMLYFPLVDTQWPDSFPIWGGERLIFFRPITREPTDLASRADHRLRQYRRRL